jgi:tetratricopeptide (TPR) repeat protein
MSPRPVIFISAVSKELRSARQLVANTLTFLGYDPEWQDIFGTEQGDLRAMLRRRIDASKGVVQLVGELYGAESPAPDEQFGRVSYTQYEALYAVSKGKKVWYLFLDQGYPVDPHEKEDADKEKLQSDYRARVKAESHLYHPLTTREGLEASVLKLRDDLTNLRRGVKRWAASVAVLLIILVALSIWLLQGQLHTNQQLQALEGKFEKLQQGINSFAEVQNKVRQEQPRQKAAEIEQRTYEVLGKQLGIDAATLKEQLPRFAEELKKSPNASTYERANAAYVAKDYNEAERLALAAADEAQRSSPAKNTEAIKAFELAGWAAEKRIEYADALKRFRDAEAITDLTRDPLEWARVQFAIAIILVDQGQYSLAENTLRKVLTERETKPWAPRILTR